jgi:cardiolipin synthase
MDFFNYLRTFFAANLTLVLIGVYIFTVLSTIILVIHEKRDPLKTSTWVLILLLLPIIGLIFYIYFGQNYRKVKIFSRKGLRDLKQIEHISKGQLVHFKKNSNFKNPNVANNIPIITLLLNNSKAILTEMNRVDIIQVGEKAFKSIIEEIEKARVSIHMQFYIVTDDVIGNAIKNILIAKAQEGLEVRLIYDDVGSWGLSKKFVKELRDAGVEVFPFMEVKFPLFTSKVNYRNHRKIIVIDGRIGYMGGMNIADRYIFGNETLGNWYDTMLKIEGEAVHVLQILFLSDWFFVSGKLVRNSLKFFTLRTRFWNTKETHDVLGGKKLFPDSEVTESHLLQITASGPDSDWASIMQAFFSAITHARKHIYIASPYFVPNESILTALKTAALSGIDVRIMLPGKSDSTVVYWSSLSYVAELLDAGIKIYLFQKGFNHSKIIMIDGSFSSVGSANMDIRSFEDNFELLAMIYDTELTNELERNFLKDLKHSTKIDPLQWAQRPLINSMKESVARLFSPLF